MEKSKGKNCVKKLHLTESGVVLALSSCNSQCSKWSEGVPRCWMGCGPARGSLDVIEQIVEETQEFCETYEFTHRIQRVTFYHF